MDARDRFVRQLDRALDCHAEQVGAAEVELLLQERAQDMRERCRASGGPTAAEAADARRDPSE